MASSYTTACRSGEQRGRDAKPQSEKKLALEALLVRSFVGVLAAALSASSSHCFVPLFVLLQSAISEDGDGLVGVSFAEPAVTKVSNLRAHAQLRLRAHNGLLVECVEGGASCASVLLDNFFVCCITFFALCFYRMQICAVKLWQYDGSEREAGSVVGRRGMCCRLLTMCRLSKSRARAQVSWRSVTYRQTVAWHTWDEPSIKLR